MIPVVQWLLPKTMRAQTLAVLLLMCSATSKVLDTQQTLRKCLLTERGMMHQDPSSWDILKFYDFTQTLLEPIQISVQNAMDK